MKKLASVALLSVAAVGCGAQSVQKSASDVDSTIQEAWNAQNNPIQILKNEKNFVVEFNKLPLTAQVARPWSDTYWPSYKGGIAARWQKDEDGFSYKTYTAAEAAQLTQDQVSKLSPAEKFELFVGDDSHKLVRRERSRTSANAPSWEGICHGWAPAAKNYTEPKPVTVTAKNGVKITFGSSDVKALLSYYQGEIANVPAKFLGSRCNVDIKANPSAVNDPACKDVNAGAFHVVISNMLALNKRSFVADVTRDAEVWNHPIFAYSSRVVGTKQGASAGAAPGTVSEVTVQTRMYYAVEVEPSFEQTTAKGVRDYTSRTYNYRLELNAKNEIIGGEWANSSSDRPDFLWNEEPADFKANSYFAPLADIYAAATK